MQSSKAFHRARVFNIPPGVDFLKVLVEALLEGRLVEDWHYQSPFDLADVTIFVPTRRAARSLADEFRNALGGSLILPDIRPLGDANDDGAFLSDELVVRPLAFDPVLPAMERRLLLAQLILRWRNAMAVKAGDVLGNENVALPTGPVDAAGLAVDLASLMDQMETEECSWDGLSRLVPDQYAQWWGTTYDFLSIATKAWPAVLEERGAMDPAAHRRAVLDHQTSVCENLVDSKGPVIVAGSTGSIPATARLLRAVCQLPKGAVVLPGVDRFLDASAWHKIGRLGAEHLEPGHPQYGLKTLLTDDADDQNISEKTHPVLPATRRDAVVATLAEPDEELALRERLLSDMMRPASTTESWANTWQNRGDDLTKAIKNVTLVEAPDMHMEALAVATALREVLVEPGKTAALITPDRELARRVRMALRRFNIDADDSAGQSLDLFPQATLLRLLLHWCFDGQDDTRLVLTALLKHPLCGLGLPLVEARRRARVLEIVALRGNTSMPQAGELTRFVADAKDRHANAQFLHASQRNVEEADWLACLDLANRLDETCSQLIALRDVGLRPVLDFAHASVAEFEAVCATDLLPFGDAYAAEGGPEIASFLRSMLEGEAVQKFELVSSDWAAFVEALMAGSTVRSKRQSHPRLSILGPLEARLLKVDRVVLGGLNEGTWPQIQRNDPFLSRSMKRDLGLEPPERRIGQAAHDVHMAMGTKEVVLSRSIRVDGAPTVPSRWLQRLEAVIGENAGHKIKAKGVRYANFAQAFDVPSGSVEPIDPPKPKPALALRPNTFSFTEIEKLIRDPYAIYAKRILRLRPIDPLISDPSAADQGTLLHAVFMRWVLSKHDPLAPDALPTLLQLGRDHFDALNLPDEMRAFWWPRFERIAEGFLAWQPGHDAHITSSLLEVDGSLAVGPGRAFTLKGRADRIDRHANGQLIVLDYKSGEKPSPKQARSLLAPQLALEALVAMRGGFKDAVASAIFDMLFVRLRPGEQFRSQSVLDDRGKRLLEAADLISKAEDELNALLTLFSDQATPYTSRTRPQLIEYDGDYDHLARAGEWGSALQSDGDGLGDGGMR